MSQELIDSVNNLTSQTTALLGEYKAAKNTVDAKVAIAGSSASEAEAQVALAKAEKDGAEAFADEAESHKDAVVAEANRAASEADRAETEADRAKSEADRASQITGLDTVEDAIDLEMQNHNPYGAMTKAERDALREQRILEGNGSGFKEWGKHFSAGDVVNEGLNTWTSAYSTDPSDKYFLGRAKSSSTGGISNSGTPILYVDGTEIELNNGGSSRVNEVKHPEAPNGTKTFDGSEVRKYEDKPGVGELHEAYTPTFDGNTWLEVPSYGMQVGAAIEFKFKWDGTANQYIMDTESPRAYVRINGEGEIRFTGLTNVTLNGAGALNNDPLTANVEYHLTAESTVATSINYFGSAWDTNQRFKGEIWDIKLEDPELPSGFRHYPNLIHQPAADPAPDTSIAPVLEKGSLEAGYQVNYGVGEGKVAIPEFPLADSMDISLSMRADELAGSDRVFGSATNPTHRLYFRYANSSDNLHVYVGNRDFTLPVDAVVGRIYDIDITIRKNADPAVDYTVTVTVNGQSISANTVIFSDTSWDNFYLGNTVSGADVYSWEGNIWDFKIEYPDAPDLNRHYKGIESEDPAGRLFVTDEEGFTDEDWGVNFTGSLTNVISVPEFRSQNFDYEAMIFMEVNNTITGQTNHRCYMGVNSIGNAWFGYGDTNQQTAHAVDISRANHFKMEVRGTVATCFVNGVEVATLNSSYVPDLTYFFIGCVGSTLNGDLQYSLRGNITDVRLTDLDNPENSRHYPLAINSATQPADDAPIMDELYNKATAPFYSPNLSGTGNRVVTIPELVLDTAGSWDLEFNLNRNQQINSSFVMSGFDGSSRYAPISPYCSADNGETFSLSIFSESNTFTQILNRDQEYNIRYENRGGNVTMFVDGSEVASGALSGEHNEPYDCIGGRNTRSFGDAGIIWDVRFTDNNDSTNSRHYPGTVYSPDSVPTGTVFEEALKPNIIPNGTFNSDTAGWGSANGASVAWDSGRMRVSRGTNGEDAYALETITVDGNCPYFFSVDYDFTESGTADPNEVEVRFYYKDSTPSEPNWFQTTANGTGTVSGIITPTTDGELASVQVRLRCPEDGISVWWDNVVLQPINDGELVNFPSGSEWALAQVSGLTEGTPKNFTGSVWNNDLPNTDGVMNGFTTPWELVRFYDAELVGTTVWQPSSLQASQKAFDYASISDAEVIISRKDLSFIEVWDEKISDKGVVFPFGNVQYSASSWEGITLYGHTTYPIGAGYAAYGEWDEDTRGMCRAVSALTEEELKRFHGDPRNNTWWDPETGEYYQTRYRIRTVEGHHDFEGTTKNWYRPKEDSYYFAAGSGQAYNAQCAKEEAEDYSPNRAEYVGYNSGSPLGTTSGIDVPKVGLWVARESTDLGGALNGYAIPLTLTQRLNSGGYHPVGNPSGCARFQVNPTSSSTQPWYSSSITRYDPAETVSAFTYNLYGAISNGSGGTGRSDQYEFYDAVYAGQVEDLRLSCNHHEASKLLEDSIRKAVRGEMRGKGKVPYIVPMRVTLASHSATLAYFETIDDYKSLTPWSGGGSHWSNSNSASRETFSGYFIDDATKTIVAISRCNLSTAHASETYAYNHVGGANFPSMTAGDTGTLLLYMGEDYASNDRAWQGFPLSPEFDSLPWVDIIGDPERIAATFPNGVVGQWIPDFTPKYTWPLNVKCDQSSNIKSVVTTDDGVSWTTPTNPVNQVANTMNTPSNMAGAVGVFYYEALSDFTEAADNTKIVGEVGNVWASKRNEVHFGNRLMPSLIGEIAKDSTTATGVHRTYKVLNYAIDSNATSVTEGELQGYWGIPEHSPLTFGNANNDSHAVKALYTLTEKDGLLYMQFHGSELIHNATDWGDNSEIPVVDGDSIRTDLNGNTVKTFCHHTMIPVGIASNK